MVVANELLIINYVTVIIKRCNVNLTKNRGWALDKSANSRRPFDRLQLKYVFALCNPVAF